MAHAPVAETPVRGAKTAESGAKTAQFDPIAGGPCREKRAADRASGDAIGGSGAAVHAPRATVIRFRTIEGGRRAQVLKTNKKGPPE